MCLKAGVPGDETLDMMNDVGTRCRELVKPVYVPALRTNQLRGRNITAPASSRSEQSRTEVQSQAS